MKLSVNELEKKARELRATCIQMSFDSKEGHLSSSLSYVDILVVLYYKFLSISKNNMHDKSRDRFILSKGHGCTSLYAVLADLGFIPISTLKDYGKENSSLPNHPCKHACDAIEYSSGSLGHGLGIGTGIHYALEMENINSKVVVLLGDGECNEGSVWESVNFAAAHQQKNLLAFIDYNGVQAVGKTDELSGHTLLVEKFRAFGWEAIEIDGNSISEIISALNKFPSENNKPTAIIAKTRTGIPFMDNDVLWHYRVPSSEELSAALTLLNANPVHKE